MDYSALTLPVSDAEVREYRARAKAAGTPRYNDALAFLGGVLVVLLFGGIITSIVVFNTIPAILRLATEGVTGFTVLSAFTLLFAVLVGVVMVWMVRLVVQGTRTWETWLRFTRFAEANGLAFSHKSSEPDYPGVVFVQGHTRHSLNHFQSREGRYFDVGTFQYVTGSGRYRTTRTWGFLAVKLDRALPHMLLDSTANNTLFGSNLPSLFRKDQVLSLEGDFDKHFTLYCPAQYERDALYVFTPDLMALLIDEAAPFDVEIVDDWLFVYSSRAFGPDPALWQRLFRIISTVGAKTLSQTERYADDRIADAAANIVAPPGRRLRTRISILAIAVVVIWGALQVARIVFS